MRFQCSPSHGSPVFCSFNIWNGIAAKKVRFCCTLYCTYFSLTHSDSNFCFIIIFALGSSVIYFTISHSLWCEKVFFSSQFCGLTVSITVFCPAWKPIECAGKVLKFTPKICTNPAHCKHHRKQSITNSSHQECPGRFWW